MRASEFVENVASKIGGDYSRSFKLLGFVLYLAEVGPDPFLGGRVMSQRTYHRWIDELGRCGLDGLALDARLRGLVNEYVRERFGGLPVPLAREKLMESVAEMTGENDALALRATSRQVSVGVKGERSEAGGREAKPSVFEAEAAGGSLREATAQQTDKEHPRRVIRGWNVQDLNK